MLNIAKCWQQLLANVQASDENKKEEPEPKIRGEVISLALAMKDLFEKNDQLISQL